MPSSFQSVIVSFSLIFMTAWRFLSVVTRLLLQMRSKQKISTTMVMATIGASSLTKSIKDKFRAEPIRMFGGSPMRVEVPPMLEEKISRIR